jgi:hypothetical protein
MKLYKIKIKLEGTHENMQQQLTWEIRTSKKTHAENQRGEGLVEKYMDDR